MARVGAHFSEVLVGGLQRDEFCALRREPELRSAVGIRKRKSRGVHVDIDSAAHTAVLVAGYVLATAEWVCCAPGNLRWGIGPEAYITALGWANRRTMPRSAYDSRPWMRFAAGLRFLFTARIHHA